MTEQAKVPAIRFAGLLTLGNSVSWVSCPPSFKVATSFLPKKYLDLDHTPCMGATVYADTQNNTTMTVLCPYRSSRCVMRECQYCSGKGLFH